MKWPWTKNGKETDKPLDTWQELYTVWIGLMLTSIVILGILGLIHGC